MTAYKISDFKVDFRTSEQEWIKRLSKKLKSRKIDRYEILRKSVDARKNLMFVYTLMIELYQEFTQKELQEIRRDLKIELYHEDVYQLPLSYEQGDELSKKEDFHRPLVIGSGPAGIFATLILAQCGLKPVLFERGEAVEKRTKSVSHYNKTGELNVESNIQFGEGGAGTFSDGKLNTGVKDASGRRNKVLKTFVDCGALPDILYDAKPHIGTDYLVKVVRNMRKQIEALGGEIRFETRIDEILFENNSVIGVKTEEGEIISGDIVALAIGHSARDSFEMLHQKKVEMTAKPFAVGFRVEHKQRIIDENQYKKYAGHPRLEAAEYKLTYQAKNERRVYSFCMCPGGRVVNSASEPERLVCNGMSYQARDLENANSAILIGIDENDYGHGVLDGMRYQRDIEEAAFWLGGGDYSMPIQRLGDFKRAHNLKQRELQDQQTARNQQTQRDQHETFTYQTTHNAYQTIHNNEKSQDSEAQAHDIIKSSLECKTKYANLQSILPNDMNEAFIEAMQYFGTKIKGFDDDGVLLTAIESRSSSPVRIVRGEDFQSISHKGLFPCGEGAGYAGGIMSAALDGIKTAEKIIESITHPSVLDGELR